MLKQLIIQKWWLSVSLWQTLLTIQRFLFCWLPFLRSFRQSSVWLHRCSRLLNVGYLIWLHGDFLIWFCFFRLYICNIFCMKLSHCVVSCCMKLVEPWCLLSYVSCSNCDLSCWCDLWFLADNRGSWQVHCCYYRLLQS